MRPLRYVCISAHEDGSVNNAEIGWGSDGEEDRLVLPLPVWTDVAMGELLDSLAVQQGRYWLQSYAALLGIELGFDGTFEDLWYKVIERNERFHHGQWNPELPFDQDRF